MSQELQLQVRDMARNFSNEIIRPMAQELDETENFRTTCTLTWVN